MLVINIPADALFMEIENRIDGITYDKVDSIMQAYLDKFLSAKPQAIMLNVCYRRSLAPSEVYDSYLYDVRTDDDGFALRGEDGTTIKSLSPTTSEVGNSFLSFVRCGRTLLKMGIDVYEMLVKKIRSVGTKVYLSIRMNDHHYLDNPAINSSFSFREGKIHTIDGKGEYYDYSQKAVQNYVNEYIKELLSRYDVDGVELDWLRYAKVLPDSKCTQYDIMHDYVKSVKKILSDYDEQLKLAVRVFAEEEENLAYGLDTVGWVVDGLVDVVTVENFYIPTNYEIPFAKWRDSIRNRGGKDGYSLLGGSDWAVACLLKYDIIMNPALVRGFCDTCYLNGADGVYLFNFFADENESSMEFGFDSMGNPTLKNCFLSRLNAPNDIDKLPRRYVHIANTNSRYPIVLKRGESYTFSHSSERSFSKRVLYVGVSRAKKLEVVINGKVIEDEGSYLPIYKGFEPIDSDKIDHGNPFIYYLTQITPYVKKIALEEVVDKNIDIKLTNNGEEISISWLEIAHE